MIDTRPWALALSIAGLAACGGAGDLPPDDATRDGASAVVPVTAGGGERSIGTLRMRDRDVALTVSSVDAPENAALREMTARAVWADVDPGHTSTVDRGTLSIDDASRPGLFAY